MLHQNSQPNSGVFTVSLDFELIWGKLDKPGWQDFRSICQVERDEIVGRLLELFHIYGISATWCTVGRMFLNRDAATSRFLPGGERLAEICPPNDAAAARSAEAILYGRDLIRQIQACPTEQEIGCHTFSHVNFATCSRERAKAELAACVSAARNMNIELKSFVYPRNRVGHLDLLPQFGFKVFRGPDPMWYESARVRDWRHRAGHLIDVARAAEPPVVEPEWNENGLWDVKGSMLYTPSYGFRQHIPVSLRVARAKKGLRRAAEQQRVFHLWFHPTDVVVGKDGMLNGLAQIFEAAADLREAGRLAIAPMCDVPRYADCAEEVPAMGLACCA